MSAFPRLPRPSYRTGYATCAAESAYPQLWDKLVGAWAPALGFSGRYLQNLVGTAGGGAYADHGANFDKWNFVTGPGIEGTPASAGVGGADQVHLGIADYLVPTKNVTTILWQRKTDSNNRVSASFGVGPSGFSSTQYGAHVPYNDGIIYWDFGGNSGNNRAWSRAWSRRTWTRC